MTRYDLYIDGKKFGRYITLERAKQEAYCGDKFLIQKVEVIKSYHRKKEDKDWTESAS